jgi:hypothetical protein
MNLSFPRQSRISYHAMYPNLITNLPARLHHRRSTITRHALSGPDGVTEPCSLSSWLWNQQQREQNFKSQGVEGSKEDRIVRAFILHKIGSRHGPMPKQSIASSILIG